MQPPYPPNPSAPPGNAPNPYAQQPPAYLPKPTSGMPPAAPISATGRVPLPNGAAAWQGAPAMPSQPSQPAQQPQPPRPVVVQQQFAPPPEAQAQPTNITMQHVAAFDARSRFDGGLAQLIGWRILGFLVTVCTAGICYPWAVCMIYRWRVKHTIIDGRRLRFTGSAVGLFGNWIKWLLLTIITLTIYGWWLGIKLEKWKVAHTTFE